MHEPLFGPTISRRIDRLLAPLQEPLCVREGAVVLGVTGRRKKENLGLDLLRLQLFAFDLRRLRPKCGRLDLDQIADDQPFELGKRRTLQARVCAGHGRILAHQEHALHFPVGHVIEVFEEGMIRW